MSDNDRGFGNSFDGVRRTQRSPREEDGAARSDAYEARERFSSPKRKAYRTAFPKGPPLSVEHLTDQLPEPIFRHLNIDDVCRETLLLVTLIGKDNVEFI